MSYSSIAKHIKIITHKQEEEENEPEKYEVLSRRNEQDKRYIILWIHLFISGGEVGAWLNDWSTLHFFY